MALFSEFPEGTVAWDTDAGCWRGLLSLRVQNGTFNDVLWDGSSFSAEYREAPCFVFPGLIDAHVHLGLEPRRLGTTAKSYDLWITDSHPEFVSRITRNLDEAIRSGVTTLCDLGGAQQASLAAIRWLRQNRSLMLHSPRVVTAGQFISKENGHAAEHALLVNGPDEIVKAIRNLKYAGAGVVKIMNDPIVFSSPELTAAREVAAELGMPLRIHTFTDEAAMAAVQCEADVIEHAGLYSDYVIQRLVDKGTMVVSTFVAALDTVVDPIGCGADVLFPEADLQLYRSWYNACIDCIPRLCRAGVRIVCGTDAGFPGTGFGSVKREITALISLGVPIEESLRGATVYASTAIGKGNRLGRIEGGFAADYLIFAENPILSNPRFSGPLHVVCRGVRAAGARQPGRERWNAP